VADVARAVLAAVLAFLAVPAVLFFVVGNPLSGGLGHAWRPASRDLLCVLVLAAWVAWAACCAQLVRAVALQVRRGEVVVPSSSLLDRLAGRIALGVLACSSLGAALAYSTDAGANPPTHGQVNVPAVHAGLRREPVSSVAVTTALHVVQPGESLWQIAEERMEDGADWAALATLNLGRDMGGGLRFIDPDHLRAGWRLHLPDSTSPPRPQQAATQMQPPVKAHLPELLTLGLGSMTCAAISRRAKRSQRGELFSGDLGLGENSEDAVDTSALLNRFAGIPALRSFEAANCKLGFLLSQRAEGGATTPRLRAICVGPAGVTFWLASPESDPPVGFESHADGAAWHVDHDQLDTDEMCDPYAPIALPIGDDDEGTWLVTLDGGGVLPILGESAPDLWRAARTAQEAWSWSDSVLVTDDPDDPALTADVAGRTPDGHVLYFGDPKHLRPGLSHRVAVVTTEMVAGDGVTVLVDRHGASIHPLGRVVRPHLLHAERSRTLEELVSAPVATVPRDPGFESGPRSRPAGAATGSGTAALAPGPADVRLLTPTPRIDGLVGELPPNRSRRAVELVAYLALHHPDEITSDRLRTRVLGSSDADAAAKTLFNIAHAARRAMGLDENGEALFPSGTRNGLYQVSPRVTIDVHRAAALVREGKACQDPQLAVAHLRAALELVEGEPLANALSGYSWWEAEGHGGRIDSVLVDAACSLAGLAIRAGQFDLAHLGLERARMVEPYSEALSRAAMEVAAAEGDADRLRHEWRDCQRRVDALDPGSSPSTRTESLYGELTRRMLVSTGNQSRTARP
jgi:DNA-binding SARP family transcriptional activator